MSEEWVAKVKLYDSEVTLKKRFAYDLAHDLGHLLLALTNEIHHPKGEGGF